MPLNPPSYMCIVISIGLSVDYCSHIAYTFLLQPEGPTALRATDSLREIGPSVIKVSVANYKKKAACNGS